MTNKCDVRDVCFSYHTVFAQDNYYSRWCHGKRWPECDKRRAINNDPSFIKEMRLIEDRSKRQDALLHNEPKGVKKQ